MAKKSLAVCMNSQRLSVEERRKFNQLARDMGGELSALEAHQSVILAEMEELRKQLKVEKPKAPKDRPYRLIIAGSRDFKNLDAIEYELKKFLKGKSINDVAIISGTARGVDQYGEVLAAKYGIPVIAMPANWDRDGTAAGPIRNANMAEIGTHLLAGWDGTSRGTANMVREAENRGLPTIVTNGERESVTYVDKGSARLDGALARSTPSGLFIQKGITKEELLAYLEGHTDSARQKAAVTAYMKDVHGIDLVDTINRMSDEQVQQFVLEHERSHVANPSDASGYTSNTQQSIAKKYGFENADNAMLADSAIEIETRANVDALRQMEILPQEGSDTVTIKVTSKPTTKQPINNFLSESGFRQLVGSLKSGIQFAGKTIYDLVKISKARAGIYNIPSHVFPTAKTVEQLTPFVEALVGLGLDTTAANEFANRYVDYNTAYQQLRVPLEKAMQSRVDNPTIRKPQHMLERFSEKNPLTAGELPPQAVFAMMVAVDSWRIQNPSDIPFRARKDRALFMYGDQQAFVGNVDIDQMSNLGLDYRFAVQDVGALIRGILGVSPVNADASAFTDTLMIALGSIALEVMNTEAQVPNSKVASLVIQTHVWNFGENPGSMEETGRNFEHGQQYNHIKFTNAQVASKAAINAHNAATSVLSNGVAIDSPTMPLQAKAKDVVSSIRNSFGDVPSKMKAVLQALQNVEWTESESLSIVDQLATGHMSVLHTLMNVRNYDAENDLKTHIDSVVASNTDKINALNDILKAKKEGWLSSFYYKYKLMNQHRIMQVGAINAQNSHLTRYLVKPVGITTYTKENIHMFKYAVMYNLGYKVDKRVPVDINNTFEKYTADSNIQAAVALLKADKLDTKALADVLLKLKTSETSLFQGTDISLISGLLGLARYDNYRKAWAEHEASGKPAAEFNKAFKSDIPLEIDGISNGFAINIMQFPKFDSPEALERHLNQTGTYVGKDAKDHRHLISGIFENGTEHTDAYLNLGALVQATDARSNTAATEYYAQERYWNEKKISALRDTYDSRSAALDQLFPDLGDPEARDLVKYPFMIFLYGGGVRSIARGVAKNVISHLYETMGELQRGRNTPEGIAAIDLFISQLKTVANDPKQSYQITKLGVLLKAGTAQEFTLNEEIFVREIATVIEPRFNYGLNNMLGDTKALREGVVQSAEIMHAIFMEHYEDAYKAELDRLERTGALTEAETVALVKKSLLKWLPQYAGPLSDATPTSFIDLSKRISARTSSSSNRVTSVTKDLSSADPYARVARDNEPRDKVFTSPGVSALIRGIINMDAALLALSLEQHPDVLPLYDAVFGQPETLMNLSKVYNESYLKHGREVNISQIMRERMDRMIDETRVESGEEMLRRVNTRLKADAFVNQNLGTKEPQNFAQLTASVRAAADASVRAKEELEQLIADKGGIGTSQLFAQDMASINTEAGVSVDSQLDGIRTRVTAHKRNVFFSLEKVTKAGYALRQRYGKLINQRGVTDALEILSAYSQEDAVAYVDLAVGLNPVIDNRLTEIKTRFAEEGITDAQAKQLLVNMLQDSTDNASRVNEYMTEMGPEAYAKMLDGIRAELQKFAVPTDFKVISEQADAEMMKVMQDLVFNSLNNQRRENPFTVMTKDITSASVTALFDTFKGLSRKYYNSAESMDNHTEALQRVMRVLAKGMDHVSKLSLTVEQVTGMTQGNFDSAAKRVRVSLSRDLPGGRNEFSPQEVYVHELLHALTVTAIRDNKLIGEQIRRVRGHAKKAVDNLGGWKAFLADTERNSTPAEVSLAKQQYEYLFGNEATNVPEEFLAYAVTNQTMIGILQTFDSRKPERGDGLLARLQHIVDVVVDQFMRRMNRYQANNAYEEMVAVTAELIDIQAGHEGRIAQFENIIGGVVNATDEKIRTVISNRITQLIKTKPATIVGKTSNAIVGLGIAALGEGAARSDATMAAYASMGDVMKHILDELGAGALTPKMVQALLFVKVNIGKLYNQVSRDAIRRLNDSWKSLDPASISVPARNAITRVIYKSDLSSLLSAGFSVAQIHMLLKSPNLVEREKAKLIAASGLKANSDAIRYAEDLGQMMMTNTPKLRNAHHNVYTIAQNYLTGEQASEDNIRRLDAIATLTALQTQQKQDLVLVNGLLEKEVTEHPDDNALKYMLESHRAYVNSSLEKLFYANPTQMQKGWIVQRIDNLTDVRTGTLADTKKMAKEGYKLPYKFATIPGVAAAHTHMFVSRWTPEIRHVSGILSTTGLHHSGTTISDILAKNPRFQTPTGIPDYVKIRAEINRIRKEETQLAKQGKPADDRQLVPLRDDKGNIVDYRVTMDSHNIEEIFKPDMEYQNVFANMNASYISKKNTIDADKRTIDLLVDEWVRLENVYKGKFIDVMDANGPHYDKYLKLPDEIKKYMQQYTVGGKFLVRDSVIYKVFGYTAKDMSNIQGLDKELLTPLRGFLRKFHYAARQVMAFGMERVVMATATVIVNNVVSNLYQLSIRKISPFYTVRKMKEGYLAYIRYEKDTQLWRDTYHKLQMATGANAISMQRQLDAVTQEIERNPIHSMSSLNSLILEDINTASTEGVVSRLQTMLQGERIAKFADKVPTVVTDIAKTMVLARSTYLYRKHKEIVQLTDLLGRYVMINHAMEVKGQSFDKALQDSIDAFVLFDENMHPWLETINSLGFTAFLSYKLRNTRSAAQMIQRSPVSVMTAAGLQYTTDLHTLANIDGSIFTGDLLPHMFQQDELIDSATTIHGLENIMDLLN